MRPKPQGRPCHPHRAPVETRCGAANGEACPLVKPKGSTKQGTPQLALFAAMHQDFLATLEAACTLIVRALQGCIPHALMQALSTVLNGVRFVKVTRSLRARNRKLASFHQAPNSRFLPKRCSELSPRTSRKHRGIAHAEIKPRSFQAWSVVSRRVHSLKVKMQIE